jgi:hypothetical protein
MITKGLFIEVIEGLKKQRELHRAATDAFQVILPNDYISGTEDTLEPLLIKVLETLMGDTEDWIGYYIYELDFGSKWEEGKVTVNGQDQRLETAEDLWDFLLFRSAVKDCKNHKKD